MLRKIINILMIFILLMITGCTNKNVVKHEYTFKGESKSWIAEYKISGEEIFGEKNKRVDYTSRCDKLLTVTYKNDLSELDSIKHIEISYKSSSSEGKISEDYDDDIRPSQTYTNKSSSGNGSIENKEETINVTINIDGNVETIKLKSK